MKKQKDDILEYAEEFAYGYDAFKNKWGVIKLFDYQKKILTDLEKNQFTVIKQSRQMKEGLEISNPSFCNIKSILRQYETLSCKCRNSV